MKGAVIYCTEQGLGRQAKSFFDHGIFSEVLIQPHHSYVNHYEWYPNRVRDYEELLSKCSEIWFFETPFDWKYITRARERGIKTVLVLMYECSKNPLPYFPDVLVGGSVMEREFFGDTVHVINVPASDELVWRKRVKAEIFIHNGGHGGIGGRNGTRELMEAMKHVKSPIKLIIRTQIPIKMIDDPRIEYRVGDFPYEQIFDEGDVFIYPDKFGGSCLPLQEAHASGMMVMASDRHPTNTWLPKECLIPIEGYTKERISSVFDSAIVSPIKIAECLDKWYNKDITEFSLQGKQWKEQNSWTKLKPLYEAL